MIVFAGITPHPPILIPEIGKDDHKKVRVTYEAMEKLAIDLKRSEPDTIIIISPHMVHYPHLFNVCGMENLRASFSYFGYEQYSWEGVNNLELAEEIVDKSEGEGLPAILYNNEEESYEIDHGATVPLSFFDEVLDYQPKILPIGYSIASRAEHYTFGQIIAEVCEKKTTERIAVIASGDMSHHLNHSVAGGEEAGREYDKQMIDLLKKGDDYSIINLDPEMVEKAGECGYRSTLILLGILSGRDYNADIYSYEGPFGVGYMVANMRI
ncbi:MAG: AmmeMemoRadiSam system protein B [Patescibacteria group bacterium]